MTRRKRQAAIATVVVLAAIAVAGYAALRETREPSAETASPPDGTSSTLAPAASSPGVTPTPTVKNAEEPIEGGSTNPATPTPSPVPTRLLCPFLPSGTDPGSPQDLEGKAADAAIASIPVLSVFAAAMQASELDAVVRTVPAVTVLAPTDDAFAADIPEDELEELLIQRHDDLKQLLERHIMAKQRPLESLVNAGRATALSGHSMKFAATNGAVRISNDANVTCSDVKAANATIHIVDSVLGYIQLTEPQEELG